MGRKGTPNPAWHRTRRADLVFCAQPLMIGLGRSQRGSGAAERRRGGSAAAEGGRDGLVLAWVRAPL